MDAQAMDLDASTAATNAAVSKGELFSMLLHKSCDPQGPVHAQLRCTSMRAVPLCCMLSRCCASL